MRTLPLILVLAAFGACKPPAGSEVRATGVITDLDVGVAESGAVLFFPGASKVSAVSSFEGGLSIPLRSVTPGPSNPVAIGSLTPTSLKYTLESGEICSKNFAAGARATCSGGTSNAEPILNQASTAFTASDYRQVITLLTGISCANWLNAGNVYQRAYDVSLGGTAAALDGVQKIDYAVYPNYPNEGKHTQTNRAQSFSIGKRFITGNSGWSIGAAKITLKTGTVLDIPGTPVTFNKNEDPAKVIGTSCTP